MHVLGSTSGNCIHIIHVFTSGNYTDTMHVPGPDPSNVPVENVKTVHAVLEEPRPRQQPQQAPIAGPALASVMKVGTRVMRGIDWKWGDQVRLVMTGVK